ncbi:MAG: ferrous iron transport protein B [Planctomycetaceae bacterium]|nr:ferrous iron transport protein B [Planctomycetales bacterium]MCB9925127.1 ferrous iron transport protein B [Planctomycetaceae bacterium]
MPAESTTKTLTVALIGNPNTGKSTLFSALCGIRQQTGNYPGVTVEKKLGRAEFYHQPVTVVDLPGSYSLAPRSPDEMIAVDVLLGRLNVIDEPDAVLCIVDASNLERNLYLVSQVLELGKPTVIALNMVDVARDRGIEIDVALLRERLHVPVIEIQANRKFGLNELKQSLIDTLKVKQTPPESPFPEVFQAEVAKLETQCTDTAGVPLPRYLVERLLLDTSGYLSHGGIREISASIYPAISTARERLAAAGMPVPAIEAMSRYQWIGKLLDGVVQRPASRPRSLSDKLDRVLTHRIVGSIVFVLLMVFLFQAVFWIAGPASDLIDWLKSHAATFVSARLAEGPLQSLLINGVIEGVGGVLVFLPQIFVLFLFIAILEDCGYMSRAAYLMDRLMSRVGLSGKSFIPLLSSFACAVPGIMSARVIENPRDRLVTILVAPLMSCSARLPVYTLLIGAFIPNARVAGFLGLQGLTMFAMYSIGILAAILVTLALRRTILKGVAPPFVMELPSYKIPGLGIVLYRMFDRGWAFVRRAGTLIFAVTILVWAAAYYPRYEGAENPSEQLRHSFLGQAGRFVEPAVEPLGWDWKIGCAAIASFPAREVVIATLGVIYNLSEDEDEQSETLRETLRCATWEGTDRQVFNIPVALSIMVFFALCAQCSSTLAVIKRETNSWRWPAFTFAYMTGLAYFAALLTYQIGSLFIE